MKNKSLIFVGPKKTGTTSVYFYLKKNSKYLTNHKLFRKENNQLIFQSTKKLIRRSQYSYIDISPEYYTSWRAMLSLLKIHKKDELPYIVFLKREKNRRNNSHLDYMVKKNELSDSFTEPEWEIFFNSQDNIWANKYPGPYIELSIGDIPRFLFDNLNIPISDMEKHNEGGQTFRYKFLGNSAKTFSFWLRKSNLGLFFVEKITPLLKKYVYKDDFSEDKDLKDFLSSKFSHIFNSSNNDS